MVIIVAYYIIIIMTCRLQTNLHFHISITHPIATYSTRSSQRNVAQGPFCSKSLQYCCVSLWKATPLQAVPQWPASFRCESHCYPVSKRKVNSWKNEAWFLGKYKHHQIVLSLGFIMILFIGVGKHQYFVRANERDIPAVFNDGKLILLAVSITQTYSINGDCGSR